MLSRDKSKLMVYSEGHSQGEKDNIIFSQTGLLQYLLEAFLYNLQLEDTPFSETFLHVVFFSEPLSSLSPIL